MWYDGTVRKFGCHESTADMRDRMPGRVRLWHLAFCVRVLCDAGDACVCVPLCDPAPLLMTSPLITTASHGCRHPITAICHYICRYIAAGTDSAPARNGQRALSVSAWKEDAL